MTRLSLEAGQVAAIGDGWLQERYHSNGGDTVGDFLSFRSVYEINPFEVGTGHARERAECSARRGAVESLLEIAPLRRRPLMSLSNGEMRRVVLARCLLKESGTVVVDGGCGGFDPEWRGRLCEVARAMRQFGVDLRVPDGGEPARRGGARKKGANSSAACHVAADVRDGTPIVEMRGVNVAFGRHVLFEDFSWTIREGERWILRGPNGSGKTTLFALITGDSPLAYACDVRVFGVRRGDEGAVLGDVRANIGEVSSVREAYLGVSAERQLDEALRPGVRLLLLDEPCCNMASGAADRFARRVVKWLKANRRAAAVWVEHRGERIPPEFSRALCLAPVAEKR